MKYTIQEERLANLIKKYITHRVGETLKPRSGGNALSPFGNYWKGNDDVIYFWTSPSSGSFIIEKDLYFGITNMFNMENKDALFLFRVFKEWFNIAQDFTKLKDECDIRVRDLKDI